MSKRSNAGHLNCSIARSLEIVGEWWTLLIIRDIAAGIFRFDDIHRDLGVSRRILSDRLSTLLESGVVERRQYSEHPPRSEYHLTEMGRDLAPVLTTLMRWGDKWLAPDGPPIKLVHRTCGHDAQAELACTACGDILRAGEIDIQWGPGCGSDPVPQPDTSIPAPPAPIALRDFTHGTEPRAETAGQGGVLG